MEQNAPANGIYSKDVPEEGKKYTFKLIRPHILAEAINARFPGQATNYAVNLGAGDGMINNDPVYPLYQQGYGGLAVEGGTNLDLRRNLPSDKITKMTGTIITPHNVASLLECAACPRNADFFKIDIDGYDGPVLKAVLEAGYLPKVLQLEVNPEIPPPIEFAVHYDPCYRMTDPEGNYGGFYGISVSYAANLAKKYGYELVYLDFVTEWTHDATLVHRDFLDVAAEILGPEIRGKSARDFFLEHPPGWTHFIEYGINSLAWRHRTDYPELLVEIWDKCLRADQRKHGGIAVPFHLSL